MDSLARDDYDCHVRARGCTDERWSGGAITTRDLQHLCSVLVLCDHQDHVREGSLYGDPPAAVGDSSTPYPWESQAQVQS
jgi:hypothetical protein